MEIFNGVFFDGKTSTPQPAEIALAERLNEIAFTTPEGQIAWRYDEIGVEIFGKLVEIRPKNDPMCLLKIEDAAFKRAFLSHLKQKNHLSWYHRMVEWGFKIHVALAAGIVGLIALSYFVVLPYIAEKAVVLIPEQFDSYLGDTFITNFLLKNAEDHDRSVLLNKFAEEMQLNNTKDLHFWVVNAPTVNAFALPDGNIVVYTGLLDQLQNYDELAGLLGHEVSHINGRHSVKMLCRNLAGYLLISIVFTDVNGIMAVIAENAQNLHSLSYSRKFEQEADEHGTTLMLQNNINPTGMLRLFDRLQEKEGNTLSHIPELILDHPSTDNRAKNIGKMIEKSAYTEIPHARMQDLFNQLVAK
ncbi:hypothetical protein AGMMS49965_14700 [Bacteroidia bacterium]|nr:hypothetical protein AGMMS49965_14700 [Bacteroidia bacterium]